METWLITGGAGFIGCNFVRLALAETDARLVILDKLTYAGSLDNLAGVLGDARVAFVEGDIASPALVEQVFDRHRPAAVVNFAAESHVDRSIDGPRNFVVTNVVGTFELLEASRRHLDGPFRFVQVSTDEVFGALGETGSFAESTPYAPNSPYAATKAAADHLVRAYHHTYGVPTLVTNCSNNYGPYQFPEKLIPLAVLNGVEGKPIPVYGDGLHVRDWLHVEDHARAILAVLARGRPGSRYNIGGGNELTNLELVGRICDAIESVVPAASNEAMGRAGKRSYRDLASHVPDRAGHDRRYAVDARAITEQLGWRPRRAFDAGLRETVRWYVENRAWAAAVQAKAKYERERLGLGSTRSRG
ncbi:MAG TPA: dTDP-glucose 4,6-dehydratase [Candidatus Polarisedimenticolaceae bacterium]|nr:dTDP-glucose 4,6-dehydratase [Candidatus Polarisedimenticolaceae bacterium]